jgi:hypothetical protein
MSVPPHRRHHRRIDGGCACACTWDDYIHKPEFAQQAFSLLGFNPFVVRKRTQPGCHIFPFVVRDLQRSLQQVYHKAQNY